MPKPIIRIEFPCIGATYAHEDYGVYRYDEFPRYSVLAGQQRRTFLASFSTLSEAQHAYPQAEWSGDGTGYREITIPREAPEWFDPANAGETWDDTDY